MVLLTALFAVYFIGFGTTGFALTLWLGDEVSQEEVMYGALLWPRTWWVAING